MGLISFTKTINISWERIMIPVIKRWNNNFRPYFFSTMETKAGQHVIYADNCLPTKDHMARHHIIFKKIPRNITKF